ncbi:uncharacterized membrane protein YgaE (UPF0421/DUF939 family) [Paenibacillus phyllosphaerae]|uniref:Uncharacterized membrane protein YgaE (UPF0421/DUF939 family) n=1 Tax=Paenibacillus phyllosphaerae TaxID=274593 RepID=A0A7W5FP59_9BACL|nr:aromatic acid exporter family protein [Paenibacillus phyllosphaerae]MBB3112015.1 uncharacterized membrane protein YgaE (UPF0421/DUF939 family) [Paenibacillus phyllosphaerae]
MKVRIGFRTMKTAIGVTLSILIAQSLGLDYFSAAGILTLLCIQKSRKQSYSAAISRAMACVSGLFYSSLLFEVIGYYPYTFLLLLLSFIPFCVWLGIQEGIASSIVIVMHVYMHRELSDAFFLNEVLVVAIGLGVALVINWYMPSIDKEMNGYRREIDRLITQILHEIAQYLRNRDTLWDGKEVLELNDKLTKARRIALLDAENSRGGKKGSSYAQHFEAKQRQFELIERMLPFVPRINAPMEQGARIGEFIELVSSNLDNQSQAEHYHEMLRGIREYHKLLPLPESREEFENRANLFAFANELERFVDTIRSGSKWEEANAAVIRLRRRSSESK